MFTVSHIHYEHTVHHSSKEPALRYLHSPMHPVLQPQRSSSRQACVTSGRVVQYIFQPPFSFLLHPIHLEMEAPESRSSSVPNSGRLGKQPALCAGKVLLVSEEDRH